MQQKHQPNKQRPSSYEAAQIAKAQQFLGNYNRWAHMALMCEDERRFHEESKGALFSMLRHEDAGEAQRARTKANLVHSIVEMLPFTDYQVIHYHYIIGLSLDRALDSLKIDRSTAYRRQRRGLLRIAQLLDYMHYDEQGEKIVA